MRRWRRWRRWGGGSIAFPQMDGKRRADIYTTYLFIYLFIYLFPLPLIPFRAMARCTLASPSPSSPWPCLASARPPARHQPASQTEDTAWPSTEPIVHCHSTPQLHPTRAGHSICSALAALLYSPCLHAADIYIYTLLRSTCTPLTALVAGARIRAR